MTDKEPLHACFQSYHYLFWNRTCLFLLIPLFLNCVLFSCCFLLMFFFLLCFDCFVFIAIFLIVSCSKILLIKIAFKKYYILYACMYYLNHNTSSKNFYDTQLIHNQSQYFIILYFNL